MGSVHNKQLPKLISSYWLDRDYTITKVGASWDEFALENGGDELISKQILGQNLFKFIASESTRMYLRLIIDHVRHINHTSTKPYRCDAPDLRRYMEMQISKEDNGEVKLDHYLIATEPITPPIKFDGSKGESEKLLKRCSMCNKVKVVFSWLDADQAEQKGFLSSETNNRVVYTICENCG